MDDADIAAEIQRIRQKVHALANAVQRLTFTAEADKALHEETLPQFYRLMERVAVLEDQAKEQRTLKMAVLLAFIGSAVTFLFTLTKGG